MDDFGDFTGFNQDHSNSVVSSHSNPSSGFSSSVLSSKEGLGSFMNANNVAQPSAGVANFATFDPDFNIPPPLSPPGANVHLAGGVPFDIPPLPDDGSFENFSPEFEIENPLKLDQNSIQSTGGATNIGGDVSHQNIPQPVANYGDFNSSVSVSSHSISIDQKDKKNVSSEVTGGDSGWAADFGSFSIPPPIDLTESSESSNNGLAEVKPETASKEIASEFANFESVPTQKGSVPVESNTESFGGFNALDKSSTIPNSANFASFGSTSGTVNSSATTEVTPNTNSFTAFESSTVFTSTTVSKQPDVSSAETTTTTKTNFDNFELPPPPLDPSFIDDPNPPDNDNKKDDSFGEFSSAQNTLPAVSSLPAFDNDVNKTTSSSTKPCSNDFGAFSDAETTAIDTLSFPAFQTDPSFTKTSFSSNSVSKPGNSIEDDFGDFSSSQITSVSNSETSRDADFGKFETSQESSNTQAKLQPQDDFGDFSSGADFATFANTQQVSNPVKDNLGDSSTKQISGFATFDSENSQRTTVTAAPSDDFGDFSTGFSSSGADDGFGDFTTSSESGDGFGDFTSSGTGFGAFSSTVTTPTPVTTKKQDVGNVLTSCFTLVSKLSGEATPTSSLHTLIMGSKTEDQSMWQSLQKCIDLAIPLYKWEKSTLQNNFYSALKVDPMLISKPSTLSVLTGQVRFEDPLGGTTAAEDLVESFGFEGDLEEAKQRSPPPLMSGTRQLSEDRATPTLLDLSLPETPGSPTGQNSFTLTEDLLGLDLNPQTKTQQLTSIQELVRNESLVVNKSNWVDPNLKEFGEGGKEKRSSQPSPPQTTKKQNTFELQLQQLGLDANKVSSVTSSNKELSLAARTVLGRLPELSFMLTADKVVQTHQYSI